MAVDQDLVDQITSTIADLYREVETALVKSVAQRLRQDPPLPSPFQEAKLDAVQALRRSAQTILAALQATRAKVIRQAVADAYRHGQGAALADLPERWFPRSGIGQASRQAIAEQLPNAAVIENIAAALHRDLGRVDGNILRAPVDAYRAVQAGTAARIASGAYTRREASQAAWQRLIDRGIVNFTDRAGRVWRLSSYVEMLGRTNIQRAAVQGQTDRLQSIGMDLVIVSNAPQECSKCRPYEGKILSLGGQVGKVQVEHATRDGVMVEVDVVATLDEARAAGFQHPNCRHSVSAYQAGITKIPTNTEDPEGDKARQKQRALEREIRAAKEQAEGALTPEAKKEANRKVRAAQAKLRAHLAENPKLKRLRYREQIGAGNLPKAGGPPGGPVGDLQPPVQPTLDGGPAPRSAAASVPEQPPARPRAASGQASLDDLAAQQRAAEDAARARREAEEAAAKARRDAEAAVARARKAAEERARREANRPRIGDLIPTDTRNVSAEERARVQEAFYKVFRTEHAGLRVEPEGMGMLRRLGDDSVIISSAIKDAAGREVGAVERVFFRDGETGTLWVEHSLLTLHKSVRGQGFASEFNAYLERWYRQSGVERIQVHADIDVGGYTWARHGFDWADEETAEAMFEGFEEFLDEHRNDPAAAAARDILRRAREEPFGSERYPTPYEMSQVGRTDGATSWLGKAYMLGSDWQGVKWLR
ncbi:phage minor capsid protein [Microbispora sp. CA-102843]|uniref:phage minor capsid protein n=1 Tax=Microbispora sp. CA-102843 TaxID=3239952 RepID=UPI003D8F0FA2